MTKADFIERLVREPDGCWLWKGNPSQRYPQVTVYGRKVSAHRYAYEILIGEIPPGLEVCHTCDTRRCCRPDHLYAATHAKNMADAARRKRMPGWPASTHQGIPGEQHPNAKLTDEDVRHIRSAVTMGASKQSLARHYEVTWQQIYNIVRRKSWKHLAP